MVYSNKVYLSTQGNIPTTKKYISLKGYVLAVAFSDAIAKGKVGLSRIFREFLCLSKIDQIVIKAYDPRPVDKPATLVQIEIRMVIPPREREEVDDIELVRQFKKDYVGYYVAIDQIFTVSFNKNAYFVKVEKIVGGGD